MRIQKPAAAAASALANAARRSLQSLSTWTWQEIQRQTEMSAKTSGKWNMGVGELSIFIKHRMRQRETDDLLFEETHTA